MTRFSSVKHSLTSGRYALASLLYLSIGFGLALLLARTMITGIFAFYFLCWNLFLAALPVFFAWIASTRTGWKKWVGYAAWILFLPNSFYILTDLFHLRERPGVPLWFDLTLILSFAWNGCALGFLSVRMVERKIAYRSRIPEFVWIYLFMLLNAFGVYIGRYWRYNSWDVLARPLDLISDIAEVFFHPVVYRDVWAMSICFAFPMTIFYLILKWMRRG